MVTWFASRSASPDRGFHDHGERTILVDEPAAHREGVVRVRARLGEALTEAVGVAQGPGVEEVVGESFPAGSGRFAHGETSMARTNSSSVVEL